MAITRRFRQLDANVTVETITADRTLTAADSSKVFLIGTDALTVTLPASVEGLAFTFINTGADGAVLVKVSPVAADAIHGTTNASTNVVLSGVDNKAVQNTKATATTGDMITLVADGTEGYFVIGCGGIWASQS